jgi:uncharacterized membrane protein required for colicin V production
MQQLNKEKIMIVFWFVIVLLVGSFIAGMLLKDFIINSITKFMNKIKSFFVKGE